jgi:hypothetical protein
LLEVEARAPVGAAVSQAMAHLARRDFEATQALLRAAITIAPHALWPRVATATPCCKRAATSTRRARFAAALWFL